MDKKQMWIVFDIDGVLTDGTVWIGNNEKEYKRLNFKDIDAIYELTRLGCKIAALTAEKDDFSQWVRNRFPWDVFEDGVSNKAEHLNMMRSNYQIPKGNLVYIGDGKKDISAFLCADIKICPKDAIGDIQEQADIVLSKSAGTGALWEIVRWMQHNKNKTSDTSVLPATYFHNAPLLFDTIEQRKAVLSQLQNDTELANKICTVGMRISLALQQKNKVLLFGNGGSAADAQHIAAEFVSKFLIERPALSAISLGTNTSILTSIGNDYDHEIVFARQIQAHGRKGDIFIAISTSGNSKNIVKAAQTAQDLGLKVIGLIGQKASKLDEYCDVAIKVPSEMTPIIQESHIMIAHIICALVEKEVNK